MPQGLSVEGAVVSDRGLFRYESRHQPLLSRRAFARRLARNFAVASLLVAVSLAGGMVGYHFLAAMDWLDSFANAAMILSGMGPLDQLKTPGAKVFAGVYALYSGLAVIVATGILIAPVVHRMLHHFHVEPDRKL
jgi:hypothetical protein